MISIANTQMVHDSKQGVSLILKSLYCCRHRGNIVWEKLMSNSLQILHVPYMDYVCLKGWLDLFPLVLVDG